MPFFSHRCGPAAVSLAPILLAAVLGAAPAAGQQSGRESTEIKPYTGPPIYLPQAEAPPEPKVVESRVVKENFPETETPRFERRVVKLSDNSVLSDGPSKEYYSNGQLYAEGNYERGKVTGDWVYYHKNGEVAKKVAYVDGKPSGEVTLYNEEGKVIANRQYDAGRRAGAWEQYDATGEQKLREDHYENGLANGVFKVWFDNGQLHREIPFVDGKQDGLAREWTRVGDKRAEVSFKAGLKDGKTTIWQRDGAKVEQEYEEGRLVPKD